MARAKVALIKCETYAQDNLRASLRQGLDLLGGLQSFTRPGETILLKPNMLFGDKPENCTTTHPEILKAMAILLKELDVNVIYGDSSAIANPRSEAKRAGFEAVANEIGFSFADFETGRDVELPGLDIIKSAHLAKGALDADGIISLCKMKPHGLTRMTGAVKNLFGCVPGLRKPEFHIRVKSVHHFCRLLVSINLALQPRLHIMDGIWAMEGNGPRGGDRLAMNSLLFSRDPVALDSVVCRLIDLNPEFIPTITEGERMGLGVFREEDVEVVGTPLVQLRNPAYRVRREPVQDIKIKNTINTFVNLFTTRPVIDKSRCIRCGLCVKTCPMTPKAINWHKDNKKIPPHYNYKGCIRCFCCQEVCPEKAIKVDRPLVGKIFQKIKILPGS